MAFGINAENRFAVLQQQSRWMAEILARFSVDDNLPSGVLGQIDKLRLLFLGWAGASQKRGKKC
jgi:hypothetical protein